jgi:hypothetical protein
LSSCNEDKGNYDYIDIYPVLIGDIGDNYTGTIGEKLFITPRLRFLRGPEDTVDISQSMAEEYTFTWYYYTGSTRGWQAIAEGRNLELDIAGIFGKPTEGAPYLLAYEVMNKEGVPYRRLFNLLVSTPLAKGYVALCETDDGFDIDMIAYSSNNNTLTQYKNILDISESDLPRKGVKPIDILTFPDAMAPNPFAVEAAKYSVFILTDQYTTRIKSTDYSWSSSYDISNQIEAKSYLDTEYIKKGKPIIVQKMRIGYGNTGNASQMYRTFIYVKDADGTGNWYITTNWPAWFLFSVQMNRSERPLGDHRYEPAPYIAVGNQGSMYYDTDTKTFKLGMFNTSPSDMGNTEILYYTKTLLETPGGVFNFSDPNTGLVYMNERQSSGSVTAPYAILNQANGSYKYIEFNLNTTEQNITNPGTTYKKRACVFPSSSKIGTAKFFASAPYVNSPWLFYVTNDNRVYKADIAGGTAVETDITSSIVSDGYTEITAFKYMTPNTFAAATAVAITAPPAPIQLSLVVGTYNASKGKNEGGKLECFLMNEQTTGDLTLAKFPAEPTTDGYQIDMSWTGLGRIVGVDYKQK